MIKHMQCNASWPEPSNAAALSVGRKSWSAAGPYRGLRREEAARYVGVSPTKFDQLVADGRMPKPLRIDGCVIWDVRQLDVAFDALIGDESSRRRRFETRLSRSSRASGRSPQPSFVALGATAARPPTASLDD